MFRPLKPRRTRRGMAIIVTLLSLTLLAIVGLTALYAAKDQAKSAAIGGQPGVDPAFSDNGMGPFNYFLGTLIYDDTDSGQGLLDPMRGHSLMATMYSRRIGSTIPWNGIGAFGATNETVTVNGEPAFPRVFFVNHRIFSGMTNSWDPEWSGNHPVGAAPGSGPGQIFIPKNAAYTYADLNNFFLAVQCPATGEILVPSFVRPNTPGSFGSLAPSNPNWLNARGATQILRPTQFIHPNFPTVPPNPDGTYTGDVQNLPGAFGPNGVQRNDSIWIDVGMPAFTLPNGKRVKALIAPLILDLDGRLNLNSHGNVMGAGAHTSGAGMGSWEVNLEKGLSANPLEARALIASRTFSNRGGAIAKAYTERAPFYNPPPTRGLGAMQLPQSSMVPWTGFNGAASPALQLPNGMYTGQPSYLAGYDSSDNQVATHPALYTPAEWGGFSLADNKLLLSKYAAQPSYYSSLGLGSLAPTTLKGSFGFPASVTAGVANNYRLDPAHANRQLFTDYAYGLDRTGLTPGAGATQAANSGLGGIDLNRPLADYRLDPTQPLSPTNMGNQVAADADRQQFASDIFVRLLVSSGLTAPTVPGVIVNANGTVTIATLATDPTYTQLRSMAQLAANIVDYIDADDISTRFVWNTTTGDVVYGVEKPRLVVNEAYGEVVNDPSDPALTDPMKKKTAANAAHVRFWLELQNPANQTYVGGVGPLGTGATAGSVKLAYTGAEGNGTAFSPFQVLIVRNSAVPASPVSDLLRNPANPNNPANVTGALPSGVTPDITYQFTNVAGTAQSTLAPANGVANGGIVIVAANVATDPVAPPTTIPVAPTNYPAFNPTFATSTITASATGTVGTALAYSYPLPTSSDTTVADPVNGLGRHVVLLQRLANPYMLPGANNPYITVDTLDDVRAADRILLDSGTNLGSVRSARTTATGTGYEPIAAAGGNDFRPKSSGKVQPYTAFCPIAGMGLASPPSFPTSLVLYQNPATPDPNATGVLHTFGRQNSVATAAPGQTYTTGVGTLVGNETLMTPYDWFVHMDRPLINQLELLHVTVGKPHEFTLNSVVPNAGGTDVTKFFGSTQYQLINNAAYAQIYRALDLLRVQPYGQMTAIGGRLAGRININTIQDKRVWDALFDVQSGNGFTQAQVDAMWNGLIASRTLNMQARNNAAGAQLTDASGAGYLTPIPGATVYDTNSATGDRPFLPFGAATIPAGGATLPNGYSAFAGGIGINDTLLRINPGTGLPWLTVTTGAHPYQQAEAARKILNNTTTVSHSFAVYATVGYFEVTNETPSGIAGAGTFTQLGREYYQSVPGDTRHKFFAIVDRSNIGLDPQQFAAGTIVHAGSSGSSAPNVPPFFTTVEANAAAGTNSLQIYAPNGQVYVNGTPVQVTAGMPLVIGTGANQEIVTTSFVTNGPNLNTITINAVLSPAAGTKLQFNHYAGESVSNIVPGNPGPQPSFDVTQPPYSYVVPHWSRVRRAPVD
jgi:hypothetical protein